MWLNITPDPQRFFADYSILDVSRFAPCAAAHRTAIRTRLHPAIPTVDVPAVHRIMTVGYSCQYGPASPARRTNLAPQSQHNAVCPRGSSSATCQLYDLLSRVPGDCCADDASRNSHCNRSAIYEQRIGLAAKWPINRPKLVMPSNEQLIGFIQGYRIQAAKRRREETH